MRPLHHQLFIQRQIVVTEQADMHGLWSEDTIYFKPLPQYLLDADFWDKYIDHNEDTRLAASGMVLSYLWLVSRDSDLKIATKAGLLPHDLEWTEWIKHCEAFALKIRFQSLKGVSKRYQYGELRLSRLNKIYRFSPATLSVQNFSRGYRFNDNRYSKFLGRKFAWTLVVFAYVSIMLTAMQLGLATNQLRDNTAFNNVSYGFTVFSLVTPLAAVTVIILLVSSLFVFNYTATVVNLGRVNTSREHASTTEGAHHGAPAVVKSHRSTGNEKSTQQTSVPLETV
jgi:hypothetical protein